MTDEEWLAKYEKLIKSGYCDNCNELNCLGSNAPYRLLEIIKKYQKALDKSCEELEKWDINNFDNTTVTKEQWKEELMKDEED